MHAGIFGLNVFSMAWGFRTCKRVEASCNQSFKSVGTQGLRAGRKADFRFSLASSALLSAGTPKNLMRYRARVAEILTFLSWGTMGPSLEIVASSFHGRSDWSRCCGRSTTPWRPPAVDGSPEFGASGDAFRGRGHSSFYRSAYKTVRTLSSRGIR